ncbi:pentatricopeptide repeat-containing protein At1g15510, chloroplastic-like [Selaginella moellendorffii]|uniref:pentatricopeptide repeat-containing protein At1g15510, chloroplastic-like n=1 Tax=Selaginella moellendorffii TaxID=88036 RepID=UPI000D1C6B60|nr:pentatricopeptide repeat-containing protein At1g15510, chloroplastic-like [Selaginella moellendorffii]|eukprot:XP_024544513.1 pentatricopeptide repeat-containing protein At1g15510, chloroplastic-like [Selaginella moellendorffii]
MNAIPSSSIGIQKLRSFAKEKRRIEEQEEELEEDKDRSFFSLRKCRVLADAKRLHSLVALHDRSQEPYLHNLVVQMYGRCGSTRDAIAAFEDIRDKNLFSWNIVLGACLRSGDGLAALELFWRMDCDGSVRPNRITLLCVVRACSILPQSARIRRILEAVHSRCGSDVAVVNSLLTIYGRWGRLSDAMAIFRLLGKNRDQISWTAMITAYAQHGHPSDALDLYRRMDPRLIDKTALISVLGACSNLGTPGLSQGKQAHALISSRAYDQIGDAVTSNALISMYAKCGSLADAKAVFDRIPRAIRTVVSWNSIIQAYALAGRFDQALELYRAMDLAKNDVTFATVLGACCSLADAQDIHGHILHSQRQREPLTGTALVQAYGRVGELPRAAAAFRDIRTKTTVTWNTLLAAYSNRGHVTVVATLFREMSLEGIQANAVTFTALDELESSIELKT